MLARGGNPVRLCPNHTKHMGNLIQQQVNQQTENKEEISAHATFG